MSNHSASREKIKRNKTKLNKENLKLPDKKEA